MREVSPEEAKKDFDEMRARAIQEKNKQIDALRISRIDKDLRKEISDLLNYEFILKKRLSLNLNKSEDKSKLYDSLHKTRQQINFYVNLGQIRIQNRTNRYLLYFTIGVFLLMVFQTLIYVEVI